MPIFVKLLATLAFLALPLTSTALEQVAAGTLNTQMSWTALSNSVAAVNTRVTNMNILVNQMLKCNNAGKVYAPNHASKDTDGCIQAAVTTPTPTPPPYGTMCGASSHSTESSRPLIFSCQGHDPKYSCPAGYSRATTPIWGGKNGQSITFCFKN